MCPPLLPTAARGLAFFILLLRAGEAYEYETYSLESECLNGSASFNLSSSGERSAALLKATHRISYSMQLSCRFRVVAPPGHHVMLSVREIDFRVNLDGTCIDYVMIKNLAYCKRLIRQEEERHFDSTDQLPPNVLEIFYRTTNGLDNKTLSGFAGFSFTITAFHKGAELNRSGVFGCANDNFIWEGLTCDGHNNCGDMSDEELYGPPNCGGDGRGPSVLIILGLLIVFVLVVMCVATLLCSKNETVTRIRRRTLSFIPRLRGSRDST